MRAALIAELGDVLWASLVAVAAVAKEHGFASADAHHLAVQKVRGRTPYMAEWGDGSRASTVDEAKVLWQQRKAAQAGQLAASTAVQGTLAARDEDEQGKLLYTVTCLVAPSGCPWTAVQTAEAFLGFLEDECGEAVEELDALTAIGAPRADTGQQAVLGGRCYALACELGDVLFCVLMAVFLAARDWGFSPLEVVESSLAL